VDNNFVALTRCYYCGEPNEIVIDRYLGHSHHGKGVSELQDKVIDMRPCNKCEELMKQGVMLIGIIPSMCDPNWSAPPKDKKQAEGWMPNPYRSGDVVVLKDDAIRRLINDPGMVNYALEKRWIFIDKEVLNMLGINTKKEVA